MSFPASNVHVTFDAKFIKKFEIHVYNSYLHQCNTDTVVAHLQTAVEENRRFAFFVTKSSSSGPFGSSIKFLWIL